MNKYNYDMITREEQRGEGFEKTNIWFRNYIFKYNNYLKYHIYNGNGCRRAYYNKF